MDPEITEPRLPHIIRRTGTDITGPIRSAATLGLHHLTNGHFRPELSEHVAHTPTREELPQLSPFDALSLARDRIEGPSPWQPEAFLKNGYSIWEGAQDQLKELLPEDIKPTNYVAWRREGDTFVVFCTSSNAIVPYEINREGQAVELGRYEHNQEPQSPLEQRIAFEQTIAQWQIVEQQENGERYSIHHLSTITNDFRARRDIVFEREGILFTELRAQGVVSMGELQEAMRTLTTTGICYDSETQAVYIDPSIKDIMVATAKLADPERDVPTFEAELQRYAEGVIVFESMYQYLEENPIIVTEFIQSGLYQEYADAFKDKNLATLGLTERKVAANMLSNWFLYQYEGHDSPHDSSSQRYLSKIPGFHDAIGNFVNEHHDLVSPLFSEDSDPHTLQRLANLLSKPPYASPTSVDQSVIDKAYSTIEKASAEVGRHRVGRRLLKPIMERGILLDNDEETLKPWRALIGTMGLAQVPGEGRPTMQAWFPDNSYYRSGITLQTIEHEGRHDKIEDSLRYIFNGETLIEGPDASPFESQASRIYEEGGTILEFLLSDDRVPHNVRDFVDTLVSDELPIRMLEQFGSISDQDPMIVNRFFPNGFEEFRTMALHRVIHDFTRGVETELVMRTGNRRERISRQTMGNWKNNDYSQVDEETLQSAIEEALKVGEHRINKLNKEPEKRQGHKMTLKDRQEHLERVLGWNTYDMWFTRWEPYWNLWTTLGPAWDCICFSRKPIFNAQTVKTY